MPNYYTVKQVASMTGTDVSTIRHYALAHGLGELIDKKVRIFSPAELRELQNRRKPGRPPKATAP